MKNLNNNIDQTHIQLTILNSSQHLAKFIQTNNCFLDITSSTDIIERVLLSGTLYYYSPDANKFVTSFFEIHPNALLKFDNPINKSGGQYIYCHLFKLFEDNVCKDQIHVSGLILENSHTLIKIAFKTQTMQNAWAKVLQMYCRLSNFLSKYQIIDIMYNYIYRCLDIKHRIYVACKIVDKTQLNKQQLDVINNEIRILYTVPNQWQPQLKKLYEDEKYIYLVFQYFAGEAMIKVINLYKMKEIVAATFAFHIIKGLKKLHDRYLYHANLNLENIICCQESKEIVLYLLNQKYTENVNQDFYEYVANSGRNLCVAPEILSKQPITPAADMFSLGACLFFMIFKKFPYKYIVPNGNGEYNYQLDTKILKQLKVNYSKNIEIDQLISQSGLDFLRRLLKLDPKKRITCREALNHQWFIKTTFKSVNNQNQEYDNVNAQNCSLKTIIETGELTDSKYSSIFTTIPVQKADKTDTDQVFDDMIDANQEEDIYGHIDHTMKKLNLDQIGSAFSKMQVHSQTFIKVKDSTTSIPTKILDDDESKSQDSQVLTESTSKHHQQQSKTCHLFQNQTNLLPLINHLDSTILKNTLSTRDEIKSEKIIPDLHVSLDKI